MGRGGGEGGGGGRAEKTSICTKNDSKLQILHKYVTQKEV